MRFPERDRTDTTEPEWFRSRNDGGSMPWVMPLDVPRQIRGMIPEVELKTSEWILSQG